jgi:4-hydroxyphenylpyruvate dioxygenase
MSGDFLSINNIDHLEYYVGNAKQSAHFYRTVFGFLPVARCGLETGVRDRASYVLTQGDMRIVLTSALSPDHPIARHCQLHGDGVKVIALGVDDVEDAIAQTRKRGATVVCPPTESKDEFGAYRHGSIATYGEVIHTFVDRKDYAGPFAPGYEPVDPLQCTPAGLLAFDHVVGNVELGMMDYWVQFYQRVMGFELFKHFDDKTISTEYSALMSKVMTNGSGRIKFPINEPAEGKKKSQIAEYLEFHYGGGVQHVAMRTEDIIKSVRQLRESGVEFLRVPDAYYDYIQESVGPIDEDYTVLRELGILVDRDEDGYLLQIFTMPVQDRPTLFYEAIERRGCQGFGAGNFKALFVSLEREQALRGNL